MLIIYIQHENTYVLTNSVGLYSLLMTHEYMIYDI